MRITHESYRKAENGMSIENTHYGAKKIKELLKDRKSIYFIGIGGINMSSLAHITQVNGYRTGGSDRVATALTAKIEAAGIEVNYNHEAANVEGYDAVVYTVAISADNPEYVRAGELGLPRISRADYLGYIMTEYSRRIGISGMHGKSTCTSMCAEMLLHSKKEPTVLSGAELKSVGAAYYIGGNENFVFEACEYMDSFLDFNPNIAVVLNIEMDHVDYFKSMEQIRASFGKFMSIAGEGGVAVINADDDNVLEAAKNYNGSVISFGVNNPDASLKAENISSDQGRYSFDAIFEGKHYARVSLSVSGYHNVYNALAAVAVGMICGLSKEEIVDGIASFVGVCRRMDLKGRFDGAYIYDDYGHHPTEIKATLAGAREMTDKKLVCVYQPHTYSRTAALFDEFVEALKNCDKVILAPIYAAREINESGVSSDQLANRIGEKATAAKDFEDAAAQLCGCISDGDVAVVMGAGDIYKVFDYIDFDKR